MGVMAVNMQCGEVIARGLGRNMDADGVHERMSIERGSKEGLQTHRSFNQTRCIAAGGFQVPSGSYELAEQFVVKRTDAHARAPRWHCLGHQALSPAAANQVDQCLLRVAFKLWKWWGLAERYACKVCKAPAVSQHPRLNFPNGDLKQQPRSRYGQRPSSQQRWRANGLVQIHKHKMRHDMARVQLLGHLGSNLLDAACMHWWHGVATPGFCRSHYSLGHRPFQSTAGFVDVAQEAKHVQQVRPDRRMRSDDEHPLAEAHIHCLEVAPLLEGQACDEPLDLGRVANEPRLFHLAPCQPAHVAARRLAAACPDLQSAAHDPVPVRPDQPCRLA